MAAVASRESAGFVAIGGGENLIGNSPIGIRSFTQSWAIVKLVPGRVEPVKMGSHGDRVANVNRLYHRSHEIARLNLARFSNENHWPDQG
jgi:hypothetical protein